MTGMIGESGTMCNDRKNCACRIAVTRVYRELKERDISEVSAFDTAARIFRLHHPEIPERESRFTIADWVDETA